MIAKTIALSAAAVCLAALAHGASPIADVLAENVLPGDASLTSYTSVQKVVGSLRGQAL